MNIDPATTALVLVDLQKFTVALPTVPLTGREVLANGVRLAKACRKRSIPVVLIRVGHGGKAAPPAYDVPVDAPFGGFQMAPEDFEIVPELGPEADDLIVDKYNWGAFYGTNLDLHLRRRGIRTLVIGGLVTNIGVDTTMRHAQERGYAQILALDATAAFSQAEHDHVLTAVAPRLSRVRTTDEIIAALGG